jgi:2-polyprenyl-3-methyl-5-hydroxy-6-metoxy-1,4-benzoquinol methylase
MMENMLMTRIVDTVSREPNDASHRNWAADDRSAARSGVEIDRLVKFWDRIAERYSKRPVADEASYQKKLAKTREYFAPTMEVLEIGCGTGSTAIAHAPHVAHIRATDISPKMIEIARAKAEAAAVSNVDFEVSSIEDLQVPDGTQDAVLALSILHLLEDEKAVIAKVHRMLKPGGVFVTSTACLRDAWKYVAVMALLGPLGRRLGLMPAVVPTNGGRHPTRPPSSWRRSRQARRHDAPGLRHRAPARHAPAPDPLTRTRRCGRLLPLTSAMQRGMYMKDIISRPMSRHCSGRAE